MNISKTETSVWSFWAGLIVGLITMLVVITGFTSGDVIKVNDRYYVNVSSPNVLISNNHSWFEFNPNQPITFEKAAVTTNKEG